MERKEAIEVIKKNWPDSSFTMLRESLETLIPELKSEDEKIRKTLSAYFARFKPNDMWDADFSFGDIVTWLEKQCEQKPILPKWKYKNDNTPLSRDSIILNKYGCVAKSPAGALVDDVWVLDYDELKKLPKEEFEKQGKQKLVEKYNIKGIGSKNAQGKLGEMIKNLKSANKIESKFHEGDWVVYDGWITKILKVTHDGYVNNKQGFIPKEREDCMRLWDITKDAKDGDVLAVELGNDYPSPFIAIYKERGLDFFNSHCFVAFDGKFYVGENGHSTEDIHPATKEQRDTLEKAMADAGYEWNAEKKELKKIVDKEQIKKNLQDNSFRRMFEKKPAEWSEEDAKQARQIQRIVHDNGCTQKLQKRIADWFESLKDRVQPQPKQEWSEDDERLFQIVIDILDKQNHLGNISRTDLIACVRKLKSLRPQNNITDEELAQARREAYNEVLDKIEYNDDWPTFDDGWSAAIWYLKKRNAMPQKQWKPSELQIEALESATANCAYSEYVDCLKELQEQLKQL